MLGKTVMSMSVAGFCFIILMDLVLPVKKIQLKMSDEYLYKMVICVDVLFS